jgi:hypothetical protein
VPSRCSREVRVNMANRTTKESEKINKMVTILCRLKNIMTPAL